MKRAPIKLRRAGARRGPPDVPPEKWRNPEYRRWCVRTFRCDCCNNPHFLQFSHGPVNGASSKGPDAEGVVLCWACHVEQHAFTWPVFEKRHDFDRAAVAAAHWAAWEKERGAEVV